MKLILYALFFVSGFPAFSVEAQQIPSAFARAKTKAVQRALQMFDFFNSRHNHQQTPSAVIIKEAMRISDFLHDPGYNHQQIPSAFAKAMQAIVKIKLVKNESLESHGTGFFVKNKEGRVFIVTDFHVVKNFLFGKSSLTLEHYPGQDFKFKAVADFSLLGDLALLEVEDYKGPVLPLVSFDNVNYKEAYLLGFPGGTVSFSGKLTPIKIKGLASHNTVSLSGFSYFAYLKGASGGPLLNREGAVIGVVQGGDSDHLFYFTKSYFIESLLKKIENKEINLNIGDRFQEEVRSLMVSARKGDSEAQRVLAFIYTTEEQRNDVEADKWRREAMSQGNTRVIYQMGQVFMAEKHHKGANLAWELAASKGHPGAMFNLAPIYESGASKNLPSFLFWLNQAAQREHPGALALLAILYIQGDLVPKDIEKGQELLSLLAEEGFSPALKALKEFHLSPLKKPDASKCKSLFRDIN